MKLTIYCDGGCRGNQNDENIGAWASLLEYGGKTKMVSGSAIDTTNNQMELISCIQSLKSIKNKEVEIEIYSGNDFKNSQGKEIANKKLWSELFLLKLDFKNISFHHCKGHSGIQGNELVDAEVNRVMNNITRMVE